MLDVVGLEGGGDESPHAERIKTAQNPMPARMRDASTDFVLAASYPEDLMAYRLSARRGRETVASFVTGSKAPVLLTAMAILFGLLAVLVPNPAPIDPLGPIVIGVFACLFLFAAIYSFLSFVVRVRVDYDGATDAISVERSTGLRRTVETFHLHEVREASVRPLSMGNAKVSAACLVLLDERVVPLALDPEEDARAAEVTAVDRLQSWLASAR